MTGPRLFPERESVALIRSALEHNGFDLAHEVLRPDYLISPFPNLETFVPLLNQLEPVQRMLMRLYTLGEAFEPETIEAVLGRDLLEANLATGLLVFDETGARVSTAGLQLVSRLGQYFVVSTSRAYPGFDPDIADIYLGPESYTIANYLQRRAGSLPSSGKALDLCTGSGIAAQSLAAIRRGVVWTGVDLSEQAIEAATFNAFLNETRDRYTAISGDLYEPVTWRALWADRRQSALHPGSRIDRLSGLWERRRRWALGAAPIDCRAARTSDSIRASGDLRGGVGERSSSTGARSAGDGIPGRA